MSDDDREAYRALRAAANASRRAKYARLAGGLEDVQKRLAAVGIELRVDPAMPHTYELSRQGVRLMYWWPRKGKTRVGGRPGPTIKTANDLVRYATSIISGGEILNAGAFARWLANRLEDAHAWQPRDADFARVYRGEAFVHVHPAKLELRADDPLHAEVKALVKRSGVEWSQMGYFVPADADRRG